MPQPLSSKLTEAMTEFSTVGARRLLERPHLASLAMEAISSWSNVESFMLNLFVQMMGGSQEMAAQIYLSLDTQSAKTRAIETVSKVALIEDDHRLLKAIIAVSKTNQKDRDKLAHHVWGVCRELPDALLLADPKDFIRGITKDKMFVYLDADFQQIISANERLCGYCWDFSFMLRRRTNSPPGSDKSKRIYDALCSQPEIRDRLPQPRQQS